MIIDDNLIEKVNNICEVVLGNNASGIYVDEDGLEYACDDDIDFFSNLADKWKIESTFNVQVKAGMTKLVLIPNDCDFVIKLDFSHLIHFDAEDEEWIVHAEVCERTLEQEQEIYKEANEYLKNVLLPVQFVMRFNDVIPVYVQKKVSSTFSDFLDMEYENTKGGLPLTSDIYRPRRFGLKKYVNKSLIKKLETLSDIYYLGYKGNYIYNTWLKRYGERAVEEIANQLYEWNINDLHNTNIIVDSDGVIRLCDYGGYHSSTHWNYSDGRNDNDEYYY